MKRGEQGRGRKSSPKHSLSLPDLDQARSAVLDSLPSKESQRGCRHAAPVAQYAPNGYGLNDMAGNVWQWTSGWYRPDYYQELATAGGVTRNPRGPDSSYDPSEPRATEEGPPRRIVPMHGSVLLAVSSRHAREGRSQHRNQPPWLPVCDDARTVPGAEEMNGSTRMKEPCRPRSTDTENLPAAGYQSHSARRAGVPPRQTRLTSLPAA